MIRIVQCGWLLYAALLASIAGAVEPIAVEPRAVIDQSSNGVINVPPGMGFVVSANNSTGDLKLWSLSSIVGFVQGENIIFATPPQANATISLLVVGLVDGKPKPSWTTAMVNAGPLPPPGPNPTPVPPTPPGPGPVPDRFHLAQVAINAATPLPQTARAICPQLAANFDAVASAAAAGVIGTTADLLADTKKRNLATQAAIGNDARPLFVSLKARMEALNASGDLKTLEDHIVAWREIADGLEVVR